MTAVIGRGAASHIGRANTPPWLITRELRERAAIAFDWTCEYCGCMVCRRYGPHDPATWSLDRIVPHARGGQYVAENVTLSCMGCNWKKGGRDFIGPIRSLATMEETP